MEVKGFQRKIKEWRFYRVKDSHRLRKDDIRLLLRRGSPFTPHVSFVKKCRNVGVFIEISFFLCFNFHSFIFIFTLPWLVATNTRGRRTECDTDVLKFIWSLHTRTHILVIHVILKFCISEKSERTLEHLRFKWVNFVVFILFESLRISFILSISFFSYLTQYNNISQLKLKR